VTKKNVFRGHRARIGDNGVAETVDGPKVKPGTRGDWPDFGEIPVGAPIQRSKNGGTFVGAMWPWFAAGKAGARPPIQVEWEKKNGSSWDENTAVEACWFGSEHDGRWTRGALGHRDAFVFRGGRPAAGFQSGRRGPGSGTGLVRLRTPTWAAPETDRFGVGRPRW